MGFRTALMLLGVVLSLRAADLTHRFKPNSLIDVTSDMHGKVLGMKEITQGKLPYFTPRSHLLIYKKPTKVLHTVHGVMYLFDLSRNDVYLNALGYDTIRIDGNLSDVLSMGIADKIYFEKEDHYKLPIQHRLPLKSLYKKVDLGQLKYFVVLSASSRTPVSSISFEQNDTVSMPHPAPLGVWAWKPENVYGNPLKKQDISRLYMQVGKGFRQALERLKQSDAHITLYGLNGAPSDIDNSTHLMHDIAQLARWKEGYSFIKGYQVDIEPYLLPGFQAQREKILTQYLATLRRLKKSAHAHGLHFSVTIPFWFDHLYLHRKNIGFSVVDIADEVVLMSYRSDIDKALGLSSVLLDYAKFAGKKVYVGLECMRIEDEVHTVYRIQKSMDACLTQKGLQKPCTRLEKIRSYTVFGKDISFWGQMDKLSGLRNHPVDYAAFGGFVLHHYDVLSDESF